MRKSFATIGVTLAAAAMAVAMPALAASSALASPVSVDQLAAAPQQAAAPIKKAAGRLVSLPGIGLRQFANDNTINVEKKAKSASELTKEIKAYFGQPQSSDSKVVDRK